MTPALLAAGVSKTYRIPDIPKRATIKDVVVRHLRREDGVAVVDALCDVSFSVGPGQSLGVVGRNGSGKTTLIRVLAGVCRPDSGEVRVSGTRSALLALGVGFHPDLTGRENARVGLLSLGLSRRQTGDRMDEVIAFSELGDFIDAPIHTYSTGMYMRLAFSVAVAVEPDVLLLDEVLAVGDPAFANKCLALMDHFRSNGTTMAIATQDFHVVRERCDLALWLQEGKVAAFGAPPQVLAAYGDFLQMQEGENAS